MSRTASRSALTAKSWAFNWDTSSAMFQDAKCRDDWQVGGRGGAITQIFEISGNFARFAFTRKLICERNYCGSNCHFAYSEWIGPESDQEVTTKFLVPQGARYDPRRRRSLSVTGEGNMNAALRTSTISLYKKFVKCSMSIPRGVARERFVRNIHDVFILNHQFSSPGMASQLLAQYVMHTSSFPRTAYQ